VAHKKKIKGRIILPQNGRASPPIPVIKTPVSLSYMYVTPGHDFCLSDCERSEIKDVMDCLRQLTTMTWLEVRNSANGGLNFTEYADGSLHKVTRPSKISKELPISGIRASDKFRVFGVYQGHIYYVLWFDRNHEIVPYRKVRH
jgi:hypothetical protein